MLNLYCSNSIFIACYYEKATKYLSMNKFEENKE